MGERFFAEERRRDVVVNWRPMCGLLAEAWHWQPSELYELDMDELAEWYEDLTEIKGAQAKAIREAQSKR